MEAGLSGTEQLAIDLGIAPGGTALVIGAGGGLGSEFVRQLAQGGQFAAVRAVGRSLAGDDQVDISREDHLKRLAQTLMQGPPLRTVIIASGLLYDHNGVGPEKSMRAIGADYLEAVLKVNLIGVALAVCHLGPLLPRQGRSLFVNLSARVGSISDNRLGGWYAYRASKAGANMIMRSFALELARTHPHAVCLSLHPGTVRTALSRPVLGERTESALTPDRSVTAMLKVMADRTPPDSGGFFDFDNRSIPY